VVFSSHNGFHTINGRAFVGNTPVFHAKVGELVQWDVIAIGEDHHTFHVHGHRWAEPDHTARDTKTIGPAESFRVRWREKDRHVALPLPRRGTYGTGHDRHLPGAAVRSRPLGLAVAALALAAGAARAQDHPPSHGSAESPARGSAAERLVDIPARLFEPKTLTALVGDTVTWRNSETATHDVEADDDSFDSGRLASGQTFSHIFTRRGRYPYVCSIHRTMNGVVEVYALALSGPPRPVPSGSRAALSGLAAAGTRQVAIERMASRRRWRRVRAVAAGADGRFRAVVTPKTSGRYRAVAGGRASRPVRVVVSARLRVAARRHAGA